MAPLGLGRGALLASAELDVKMWRCSLWLRRPAPEVKGLFGDLAEEVRERTPAVIDFAWRHLEELSWLLLARHLDAIEDAIGERRAGRPDAGEPPPRA